MEQRQRIGTGIVSEANDNHGRNQSVVGPTTCCTVITVMLARTEMAVEKSDNHGTTDASAALLHYLAKVD
jgi:hypothetical protein